jgi:hypothetical protein
MVGAVNIGVTLHSIIALSGLEHSLKRKKARKNEERKNRGRIRHTEEDKIE